MTQEEKREIMEWAWDEIQEHAKTSKIPILEEDLNPYWKAYNIMDIFLESVGEDGKSKAFEIFKKLIKGMPLTPLENREEDWVKEEGLDGIYYHKRRKSLYKIVSNNGTRYTDNKRVVCINSENYSSAKAAEVTPYSFPYGVGVVDHFYPIEFPYMPNEHPIRLYTVDFIFKDIRYVCLSTVLFPDKPAESLRLCFEMDHEENAKDITHDEFISIYAKYDKWMQEVEEDQNVES